MESARARHLRSEWPATKQDAPAAKALFEAAKCEQQQEDAAAIEAKRRKAILGLAAELKYAAIGGTWERIKSTVAKIQELM